MLKNLVALIVFFLGLVLICFSAWIFGIVGWWKTFDTDLSPDRSMSVTLEAWHVPGPLYSWDYYPVKLHPSKKFNGITPTRIWRETPSDITSPKMDHFLCRYNSFDDTERRPIRIQWIGKDTFRVEGGEAGFSEFKIVK